MQGAKHAGGGRIAAVQGLRAIAILLVVGYHAGIPVGAGYVGVDVFFVISGFVITRMVLRQAEGSGRIDFRRFWAGRVRRLLPALALMVVVTVLLAIPLGSPVGTQHDTALSGIGANLWVSNGVLAFLTLGYFGANAEDNPLLHTWSLAVEEQFYIFFPILVAVGLWLARRRRWHAATPVGVLLTLVAVPSFLLCVALTYVELPLPIGEALAFYSPMTRAWEFAAGALVALALQRGWRAEARWTAYSGAAGLALLGLSLVVITDPAVFPGWIAAIPVLGSTLLVLSSVREGWTTRLLAHPAMTFLGDVSYGWYLFHWPLLVYTRTFWRPDHTPWWAEVLAVLAALGLAVLSYRYVEEPIRHRHVFSGVRTLVLGAAIAVPALLVSFLTLGGTAIGWGSTDVRDMQAQLDHGQWKYQAVCQSPVRVDRRSLDACRLEGSSTARPIILMGDSNAGVYADALVAAAKELDRTITVATVPSCALVDVEQAAPGKKAWIDCADFYRASMEWLAKQEPSVVVVASAAGGVQSSAQELRLTDGDIVRGAAAKSEAWQAALTRTYTAIEASGSTVLPVGVVPHFLESEKRVWSPRSCRMVDLLDGPGGCGLSMTRTEADERQAGVITAERGAARAAGVRILDLRGDLCPDDRCATNQGESWDYEDGAHLSFPRAMELVPRFVAALRAHR